MHPEDSRHPNGISASNLLRIASIAASEKTSSRQFVNRDTSLGASSVLPVSKSTFRNHKCNKHRRQRRTQISSRCPLLAAQVNHPSVSSSWPVAMRGWYCWAKNLPDELSPAAHAGLVEDGLEVVPHGVGRYVQLPGDFGRRQPAQDEPRCLALALCQAVSIDDQRCDLRRPRLLKDDSYLPLSVCGTQP